MRPTPLLRSKMATHADHRTDTVEFIYEDDGTVTAKDVETGLARGGESKADALTQLAEVLTLHEGGGEPIEDEEAFLQEIGINPDETPDEPKELPDFLQ